MMSALGQKQIFAVQKVMSALHPKADTCGAKGDVRFGPIADIINSHIAVLLSVRIIDLGGAVARTLYPPHCSDRPAQPDASRLLTNFRTGHANAG
jgi:hypothetical protein